MTICRSFAEYVKNKCYTGLCQAAETYIVDNRSALNLYSSKLHRIGNVEMADATVQRVYVRDLPGTRVAFEVGLELDIILSEGDHRYDCADECFPWIRIYCEGDLACGLDDWRIIRIEPYDKKSAQPNSLSDALVPYISYAELDKTATEFLKVYYPEALKITPHGQPPIGVDPIVLAEKLGLTVRQQRIREDSSVFGQIYFEDTDVDMFDADAGRTVPVHIDAKTIVVDPQMFLLRNLGSVNNTIVHECVHWVKHRKVFMLEKLFNADASNISCEVVGGAAS